MHGISRKTATKAGVTVVASLALVGALASASSAKGSKLTYTTAVGGTSSGTATLKGATTGPLAFEDVTRNIPAQCTSAAANSTSKLSTTAPAAKLATIVSSTYVGCKAAGELDLAVTAGKNWEFNATGATSGGVTPGTLTKISAAVKDTDGLGCSFTIGGTVDATYTNSSTTLGFAPLSGTKNFLKISKQKGNCLGLINNGDDVTLTGSFAVTATSPTGAFTITSN
jgi:hypothetical protein